MKNVLYVKRIAFDVEERTPNTARLRETPTVIWIPLFTGEITIQRISMKETNCFIQ